MGAKISIIYFKIIEVDVTNLLHLRAKMNRKREPSKFMLSSDGKIGIIVDEYRHEFSER